MDPDITRLLAIPGTHDLSLPEAAEVLQLSECSVARLARKGTLECKRHAGRGGGTKPRVRIPRAAVVRYLVHISTGDKAAILAAVACQCPQYLPAAQGLPLPAAILPDNVIPIRPRARRLRVPMATHDPRQLDLFDAHAHLPAALDLLPARKA